jgi:hypothetical protein
VHSLIAVAALYYISQPRMIKQYQNTAAKLSLSFTHLPTLSPWFCRLQFRENTWRYAL